MDFGGETPGGPGAEPDPEPVDDAPPGYQEAVPGADDQDDGDDDVKVPMTEEEEAERAKALAEDEEDNSHEAAKEPEPAPDQGPLRKGSWKATPGGDEDSLSDETDEEEDEAELAAQLAARAKEEKERKDKEHGPASQAVAVEEKAEVPQIEVEAEAPVAEKKAVDPAHAGPVRTKSYWQEYRKKVNDDAASAAHSQPKRSASFWDRVKAHAPVLAQVAPEPLAEPEAIQEDVEEESAEREEQKDEAVAVAEDEPVKRSMSLWDAMNALGNAVGLSGPSGEVDDSIDDDDSNNNADKNDDNADKNDDEDHEDSLPVPDTPPAADVQPSSVSAVDEPSASEEAIPVPSGPADVGSIAPPPPPAADAVEEDPRKGQEERPVQEQEEKLHDGSEPEPGDEQEAAPGDAAPADGPGAAQADTESEEDEPGNAAGAEAVEEKGDEKDEVESSEPPQEEQPEEAKKDKKKKKKKRFWKGVMKRIKSFRSKDKIVADDAPPKDDEQKEQESKENSIVVVGDDTEAEFKKEDSQENVASSPPVKGGSFWSKLMAKKKKKEADAVSQSSEASAQDQAVFKDPEEDADASAPKRSASFWERLKNRGKKDGAEESDGGSMFSGSQRAASFKDKVDDGGDDAKLERRDSFWDKVKKKAKAAGRRLSRGSNKSAPEEEEPKEEEPEEEEEEPEEEDEPEEEPEPMPEPMQEEESSSESSSSESEDEQAAAVQQKSLWDLAAGALGFAEPAEEDSGPRNYKSQRLRAAAKARLAARSVKSMANVLAAFMGGDEVSDHPEMRSAGARWDDEDEDAGRGSIIFAHNGDDEAIGQRPQRTSVPADATLEETVKISMDDMLALVAFDTEQEERQLLQQNAEATAGTISALKYIVEQCEIDAGEKDASEATAQKPGVALQEFLAQGKSGFDDAINDDEEQDDELAAHFRAQEEEFKNRKSQQEKLDNLTSVQAARTAALDKALLSMSSSWEQASLMSLLSQLENSMDQVKGLLSAAFGAVEAEKVVPESDWRQSAAAWRKVRSGVQGDPLQQCLQILHSVEIAALQASVNGDAGEGRYVRLSESVNEAIEYTEKAVKDGLGVVGSLNDTLAVVEVFTQLMSHAEAVDARVTADVAVAKERVLEVRDIVCTMDGLLAQVEDDFMASEEAITRQSKEQQADLQENTESDDDQDHLDAGGEHVPAFVAEVDEETGAVSDQEEKGRDNLADLPIMAGSGASPFVMDAEESLSLSSSLESDSDGFAQEKWMVARGARQRALSGSNNAPAHQLFPSFFKAARHNQHDDTDSENDEKSNNSHSRRHSRANSWAALSDMVSEEDDSDQEADQGDEALITVAQLFQELSIGEKYARICEANGVFLSDMLKMSSKKLKKLVPDRTARGRLNSALKTRRREILASDAKMQDSVALSIEQLPDNLNSLFVLLRIPTRYTDVFEGENVYLSDLTALSDKKLKKLLPHSGPRNRLRRFLRKHMSKLKKRMKEFAAKDNRRRKTANLVHDSFLDRWVNDQYEQEKAEREEAARLARSMKWDWEEEFERSTLIPGEKRSDRSVVSKGRFADQETAMEAEMWDHALRAAGRGYASVHDVVFVTSTVGKEPAVTETLLAKSNLRSEVNETAYQDWSVVEEQFPGELPRQPLAYDAVAQPPSRQCEPGECVIA